MLCTFVNPLLDLLQTIYNVMFFWAPSVGLSIPDTQVLFGSLIGCGTTAATGG